jgi:type II secretory pathway component PulF
MALFNVIYREPGAAAVRGSFEGDSESAVASELAARGFSVLMVEATSSGSWREKLEKLSNVKLRMPRFGASPDELSLLCEVFKTLYSSGIPLLDIVSMTIKETANPWLRKKLEIVLSNLKVGDSLATALSDPRCAKAFPRLMREMVHVGEENGRLDASFEKLAATFRQMAETKREMSSALTYPAFTLVVFFAVCTVLAIMIPEALAKFVGEGELDAIRGRLPVSIKILFALHDNPARLAMPPAVAAAVALLWNVAARFRRLRYFQDALKRRLPVVGKLFTQSSLIRFLDVVAANQESGIQIDESLKLAGGSAGDAVLEASVARMRAGILKSGCGLADAMAAEGEDLYPGLVRQMARAGEESGHLPEMLRPVVEFYSAQLHASLKKALDMITPAMIVALGSVVGPIIMGVFKTISMMNDAMAG